MDNKPKQRIGRFQITAETERLVERLQRAEIDEVISYVEMTSLIGIDVQLRGRSYLMSARNIVNREGILFDTIRTVGIVRCGAQGWVDHAKYGRKRIKRLANHSLRQSLRMPQTEYDLLDKEEKTALNLNRTLLAIAREGTGQKTLRILQPRVEEANTRLTLQESIKAMSNSGEKK